MQVRVRGRNSVNYWNYESKEILSFLQTAKVDNFPSFDRKMFVFMVELFFISKILARIYVYVCTHEENEEEEVNGNYFHDYAE